MKLRLIVVLALAFGCVGLWCQAAAAANSAPASSSANAANTDATRPATAVVLPGADNPDSVLFDQDRYSIAKMLNSARQRNITSTAGCENNTANNDCPNNGQSCGTGCCTSDQQCCSNMSTGGHYCATKCN